MRDNKGTEFDSVDAVARSAARSWAEIGTGRLARGEIVDVVIKVQDERNQRVSTVSALIRIDWHATPPHQSPWST